VTSQTEIRRRDDLNAAPRCVLLLEDNFIDFDIATFRLGKIKLRNPIVRVCTADELMEYLRAVDSYLDRERFPIPAVVIIDQRLPGVNGLEAQGMMRSEVNCRRIPIIAISSSENLDALKNAVHLGADAWMVKPFDAEEFAKIAVLLELPVQFGDATVACQPA
jgi:two-component system response regulator